MSDASGWRGASPIPLAARVLWGSVLLFAPATPLRLMGGADEGTVPRRVMRVLGARHLLQAAGEVVGGGRAREIGVGTDVLHGVTDIIFGSFDGRWRRAAFTDGAITGAFALTGILNR